VPGLNGCNLAPLHHGRHFNWRPQGDFGWGEGQHAGRCRRACELHTGKWHPDLLREAGPRGRCAVGLWATGEAGHWTTVADILADACTVITYDRRGNSRSPRPPGWTSTTAGEQADAAAALLRGLDLVPAIVFGTGAAAGILAGLCLRHPHVLRGAIFQEPAFPSGVPDIGAVNAARQARVEEGMARGGPRAAMELFLRGTAGDEAYAWLDPQLRERLLGNAGVLFGIEMAPYLAYEPTPGQLAAIPVPARSQRAPTTATARPATGDTRQRNGSPPTSKPLSSNCPARTWATWASPSTSPEHCGQYWTSTPDPKRWGSRGPDADQAPDRAGICAAKRADDLLPPEP
jgi:pimeloyl-ACP methyl ester carboxylesterase